MHSLPVPGILEGAAMKTQTPFGSGRRWRLLTVPVIVGALFVTMAVADIEDGDRRTQVFEGSGSRDISSEVFVYLLEGTYRHRLMSSPGCAVSAGLAAGGIEPEAFWRDLMPADLSVGEPGGSLGGPDPVGSFEVTRQGWAQLQVGTSADCSWTYSITGIFLPSGREPGDPDRVALLEAWRNVLIALVAIVGVVLLARRRRSGSVRADDLPKVRPLS